MNVAIASAKRYSPGEQAYREQRRLAQREARKQRIAAQAAYDKQAYLASLRESFLQANTIVATVGEESERDF